nr:hypothetical protein [Escherichia coli]
PPPVLDVAGGPELEAENQILVAQFRQVHNPHQLERLIRGIQVVVDGQENLSDPVRHVDERLEALPIASNPVV